MSKIDQVHFMHEKFGVHEVVEEMPKEKFLQYLRFRASQIQEEVDELADALDRIHAEDILDALVDIKVFVDGTLDLVTEVPLHAEVAYKRVMESNLVKEVGVKPGRPNPFHLPDLVKPRGWKAPDLSDLASHLEERIGNPD